MINLGGGYVITANDEEYNLHKAEDQILCSDRLITLIRHYYSERVFDVVGGGENLDSENSIAKLILLRSQVDQLLRLLDLDKKRIKGDMIHSLYFSDKLTELRINGIRFVRRRG